MNNRILAVIAVLIPLSATFTAQSSAQRAARPYLLEEGLRSLAQVPYLGRLLGATTFGGPSGAGTQLLSGAGYLGGFVFLDYNNNKVLDAGEPRLSGFKIRIRLKGTNLFVTTTTNSLGFYYSGPLFAPAQYVISANRIVPDPVLANHAKIQRMALPMVSVSADIPVPPIAHNSGPGKLAF